MELILVLERKKVKEFMECVSTRRSGVVEKNQKKIYCAIYL